MKSMIEGAKKLMKINQIECFSFLHWRTLKSEGNVFISWVLWNSVRKGRYLKCLKFSLLIVQHYILPTETVDPTSKISFQKSWIIICFLILCNCYEKCDCMNLWLTNHYLQLCDGSGRWNENFARTVEWTWICGKNGIWNKSTN